MRRSRSSWARIATPSLPVQRSLRIKGRIGSLALKFLIDTGCTKSVLSGTILDRIQSKFRSTLQTSSSSASLVDGSQLPLIGTIQLPLVFNNITYWEEFLVGPVAEGAILGMSFLAVFDCTVSCGSGVIKLGQNRVR